MNSFMTYCGVVIPVHAETDLRVEQLHKTLYSMRNQGTCITVIVDDDSTKDLHLNEFTNSKLRYLRRTKAKGELKTASCALNTGFDALLNRQVLSSEETLDSICYLHSDDLLPDGSINLRRSKLSPSIPFVYSKFLIIDEYGTPLRHYGEKSKPFSTFHPFPHHSSMWSMSFFRDLKNYICSTYSQPGIFDETILCSEDRDVSISTFELLKAHIYKSEFIESPCYHYRSQDDSITGNNPRSLLLSHSDYVDRKHGFNKFHCVYQSLIKDLPWSLGYNAPELIKSKLRPIRDKLKS